MFSLVYSADVIVTHNVMFPLIDRVEVVDIGLYIQQSFYYHV